MTLLLTSPLYVRKAVRTTGPGRIVCKAVKTGEDRPPVVTVDLDGTLAEDDDTRLGERRARDGAAEALARMRAAGIWVIIWTANEEGEPAVIPWLAEHGIPYDEINNNSWDDGGTRKIRSDAYLDDKAIPTAGRSWDELAAEAIIEVLGKARQPIDKYTDGYDELKELADQAQPELERLLSSLDFRTVRTDDLSLGEFEHELFKSGGLVLLAPIKRYKRASEKVEADYAGNWRKLLDMVRAAVAVDTQDEVQQVLDMLKKAGAAMARPPKDRIKEPLANGYRDVLVNYRLPCGMICEVQLHLKPMLIAREKAQLYYDVVRSIKASMEEEGREDYTPAEAEAIRRAKKANQHIFARAWEECQARDEGREKQLEEVKPENCTCGYPDEMVRNGSGHQNDCPCHQEWQARGGFQNWGRKNSEREKQLVLLKRSPLYTRKGWVTIGGGSGGGEPGHDDEEHHGGTRVNIGPGGKITHGPSGLVGHDVDNLPDRTHQVEDKPKPSKKPKPTPKPTAVVPETAPPAAAQPKPKPTVKPKPAMSDASAAHRGFKRFSEGDGEDIIDLDDVESYIGTKNAGNASLQAFITGAYSEINSDPTLPASRAMLDMVSKLPDTDSHTLTRVMAFRSDKERQAFLRSLGEVGSVNTQQRTFASWNDSKQGTGQGDDIVEQYGKYRVVVNLANPIGAKDIGLITNGEADGGEVLTKLGDKHRLVKRGREGDTYVIAMEGVKSETKGETVMDVAPEYADVPPGSPKAKAVDRHQRASDIYNSEIAPLKRRMETAGPAEKRRLKVEIERLMKWRDQVLAEELGPEKDGSLKVMKGKKQNFVQFLAERGVNDPGLEHGHLSPSGSMSNRARTALNERREEEFRRYREAQQDFQKLVDDGEIEDPTGRFTPRVGSKVTENDKKAAQLRHRAAELRGLAERGMKPIAYRREADKLDAEAARLDGKSYKANQLKSSPLYVKAFDAASVSRPSGKETLEQLESTLWAVRASDGSYVRIDGKWQWTSREAAQEAMRSGGERTPAQQSGASDKIDLTDSPAGVPGTWVMDNENPNAYGNDGEKVKPAKVPPQPKDVIGPYDGDFIGTSLKS